MTSRSLLSLAGLLAGLVVCAGGALAHEFTAKGITVSHPWLRATPGGAKVGAGYLTITAAAGTSDTLVGARTTVAGRTELHTHIHEGDVMKMRAVDKVEIGGGATVLFQPSGYHLMLLDLKQPLKEGDLVKLTLQFAKAGELEIEAGVEPIGAKGPHGLDYQPAADGSNPAAGDAAKAASDHGAMHKH